MQMSNHEKFLRIIRSEQTSALDTFARMGLSMLVPFYRAAVAVRNFAFDTGIKKIGKVDCPVISIGNLTVGGTGKTPMVAWLVRSLLERDLDPVIVSRGYGADGHGTNDEFKELKKRFPQVPHLQNRDRLGAAKQAIDQYKPDLIVLDDGFQHRRLARNFDIVLIDCRNPFGYGRLLPRGFLREPKTSLRRADAVVLTRASDVNEETRQRIRSEVYRITGQQPVAEVNFKPIHWQASSGSTISLPELHEKSVVSFCGIGNPDGFQATLKRVGVDSNPLRFPDHHHFQSEDVRSIARQAEEQNADFVVCTMKDLVKIESAWPESACALLALVVDAQFENGESELMARILKISGK